MFKFGVIVSYDCTSNKLRNKIIDACLNFGLSRIQYSIFTGTLVPSAFKDLKNQLEQFLEVKKPISIFIQKFAIGEIKYFTLIEYKESELHRFKKYKNQKII